MLKPDGVFAMATEEPEPEPEPEEPRHAADASVGPLHHLMVEQAMRLGSERAPHYVTLTPSRADEVDLGGCATTATTPVGQVRLPKVKRDVDMRNRRGHRYRIDHCHDHLSPTPQCAADWSESERAAYVATAVAIAQMSGRRGAVDDTDPSDSQPAAASPAGRLGGSPSPTKWSGAAAASSMLLASDATTRDDEDRLAAATTGEGQGQGQGTLPHWIPNTLEDASTVHSTLASGPGSFHGPEGKVRLKFVSRTQRSLAITAHRRHRSFVPRARSLISTCGRPKPG